MSLSPITTPSEFIVSDNSTAAAKASAIAVEAATSESPEPDEVTLSLAARARMMYQEGVTPENIAAQLGISVDDLSDYISALIQIIPDASVTTSPAPRPPSPGKVKAAVMSTASTK